MSGQKFIARNRAPRVQIEYDVELYGAQKTVQLPFVMGVMADLAGKSDAALPALADRGFLSIDVDNFDDRMAAIRPRASFSVPNTLTGEGALAVDLAFGRMEDFSPAAVARQVAPLAELLKARTELSNLLTYMDGKAGAEDLVAGILSQPGLLAALAAPDTEAGDLQTALASLRATSGAAEPVAKDATLDALAALRGSAAATGSAEPDGAARALALLRGSAPVEAASQDAAAEVLAALRGQATDGEPDGATPDLGALLGSFAAAPGDAAQPKAALPAARDALLAAGTTATDGSDRTEDLAALLADVAAEATAAIADVRETAPHDLSALLAVAATDHEVSGAKMPLDDLDALLAGDAAEGDGTALGGEPLDDLDALLAGDAAEGGDAALGGGPLDDLDALLAGDTAESDGAAIGGETLDDLDALLAGDPAEGDDGAAIGGETLDDLDALLAGDPAEGDDGAALGGETLDDLDALLAGDPAEGDGGAALGGGPLDDLEALLAGDPAEGDGAALGGKTLDDLDALLSGDAAEGDDSAALGGEPLDDLDALLAGDAVESDGAALGGEPLDDLDALLAGDAAEGDGVALDGGPLDDLDALLAGDPAESNGAARGGEPLDDLDAFLAGVGAEPVAQAVGSVETQRDALDDLLADAAMPAQAAGAAAEQGGGQGAAAAQDAFGSLAIAAPDPARLSRDVFRIAILADCSGRAASGKLGIGDDLAARRAIRLDVDRLDEIIAGFATTLNLQVGADGASIGVELPDLDALHPDALFDSVELFSALKSLRQSLSGSAAAHAIRQMQGWALDGSALLSPQRARSAGGSVPADRRLDDLAALMAQPRQSAETPVADLLARAVGPHVVAAPHPEAAAYRSAVDAALTDAMRLVLHHPEFRQIEATWRTLDFLARRIETDAKLQITLYDISAEEFAADLAATDDLSQTGLFRLLAEAPLSESGAGGFSAIFGLYGFEETPPHAALLARMAQITAWADAPFVTGLSNAVMDTPPEDRHPLVSAAWDRLRGLPQAKWLGLALPRFMLRQPYGKKSDPVDSFPFEEFDPATGLSSLLWGHPAAVVAVLLARSWTKGGRDPAKVLSLGEMPFHYMTDRYGDQVALPCTERNLTLTRLETVTARGLMPLVSIRGRDQVRLASFQSFGGGPLMGQWSDAAARSDTLAQAASAALLVAAPAGLTLSQEMAVSPAPLDDLDALLAEFADPGTPEPAAGGIDAELAALLEGL